jgi:carbonic anhydrase
MQLIEQILKNNKEWVEMLTRTDPDYFERREKGQAPHFFFIGCSDSRVPSEALTGAAPGEMFVHRNIANQAWGNDVNLQSGLLYAVEVLDVRHVIVCGHYNCGGVKAAMGSQSNGLVDYWLADIRETFRLHRPELDAMDDGARFRRLVELNVVHQVQNLAKTPTVQAAWARGRRPLLHGMVYDLHDGLLKPLLLGVDGNDKADAALPNYKSATGAFPMPTVKDPLVLRK